MDTYEYLAAARDLIAIPSRHRTGILAADEAGKPVSPLGPAAGYCVVGALQHVTGRIDWPNADGLLGAGQGGLAAVVYGKARDMFPQFAGACDPLGEINNGLGHQAVMDLLDACLIEQCPVMGLELAGASVT